MLVSGSADIRYATAPADLRVNVPSGMLFLRDGTAGGAPIADIAHGLPATLISQTELPSGFVGASLQRMQNEFPTYSRISWDGASIGAQILTPISMLADEVIEQRRALLAKRFAISTPVYEQGHVQQWIFGESNDLNDFPPASGRLGTDWFDIPVTRHESVFWNYPPTRLETTSVETSGWLLKDYTQVGISGLVDLGTSGTLMAHNFIYVHVSGASVFQTEVGEEGKDLEFFQGYIEVRGRWAHDNHRHHADRIDRIPITANGVYPTQHAFSKVNSVRVMGVDPAASVKITSMNFQPQWRGDPVTVLYSPFRDDSVTFPVFWQRMASTTSFSGIVQTEVPVAFGAADEFWLAKSKLSTDTFFDRDVEWALNDFWKITQPDGTPLSGVTDFVVVPDTKYIFALTPDSQAWVVDVHAPSLDMSAFPETRESPARIELGYPLDSSQSPSQFQVIADAQTVHTREGISRYRWSVHHSGIIHAISGTGSLVALSDAQWRYGFQTQNDVDSVKVTISGTGQYTFELEVVSDQGTQYRTYTALQVLEKKALGALPVRGLSAIPSGIDFDFHGRPWVTDGSTAVRLVMRTDVGTWLTDERVLLTREPYDEVRR